MRSHRPDTATLLTARAMLYFAHDWHLGHLVPPAAAALYARFVYAYSPSLARRYARKRSSLFRQAVAALEYLTVPGIMLHYAVRKSAIERLLRAGIEAGCRQVVVLGPGFDTLSVRLYREYPAVRFIEMDKADVQTIKRRALEGIWTASSNLSFVEGDPLRDPLDRCLLESQYESGIPTLFVVEGLLPFVRAEERDMLFDFISVLSGPGSSVVFTSVERRPDGRIHFRRASWLARLCWLWLGQRFRWGPDQVELRECLAARGLALKTLLTANELRVLFLDGDPDVPLAEGEDIVVAEVPVLQKP